MTKAEIITALRRQAKECRKSALANTAQPAAVSDAFHTTAIVLECLANDLAELPEIEP